MNSTIAPVTTIRDHIRESKLFRIRVKVALLLIFLGATMIVARLIYLQILNHEHYTTLSENNRISIVALPPTRGLIYEREGFVLAQNLPSFSLEIVPEQVKDLNATLAGLAELMQVDATDLKRFRKMLKQKRTTNGVPLRFHLSEEEIARFAVNRPRFPGVDVTAGLTRDYPFGALGVHALGYVGRINDQELPQLDAANYSRTTHIGKTGIEHFYEAELHGKAGYEEVETNAQGRRLRVLKHVPPVAGKNLHLSLDLRMQALAEGALGDNRGAVVALEVNSGQVLAFASMPNYDPNPFVNGIDYKSYQALSADPDRPFNNRALTGVYPPGSTVKPFVGLGGVELNVFTPEHSVYDPGFFRLPGKTHQYRDWKRGGHGQVNLDRAIVESCDVYFYTLAQALGIDRLHDYLAQFGFGAHTGIDISGEVDGLLPSREWKRKRRNLVWYPGETLITGIGQGFMLTTPLQLAVATAALVNRGVRLPPRTVQSIEDPVTGALLANTVLPLAPIPVARAENWERVITAMTRVVNSERGTARAIRVGADYMIGGKTGTSQVFGMKQNTRYSSKGVAEKLLDHALFIAFAPAENPRIVVAVIVENGMHGATTAAPIARMVMDQYFADNPAALTVTSATVE